MKPWHLILLLLVVPMVLLNPLGRPAFLGYYAGVLSTWAAYMIAFRRHRPLTHQSTQG